MMQTTITCRSTLLPSPPMCSSHHSTRENRRKEGRGSDGGKVKIMIDRIKQLLWLFCRHDFGVVEIDLASATKLRKRSLKIFNSKLSLFCGTFLDDVKFELRQIP